MATPKAQQSSSCRDFSGSGLLSAEPSSPLLTQRVWAGQPELGDAVHPRGAGCQEAALQQERMGQPLLCPDHGLTCVVGTAVPLFASQCGKTPVNVCTGRHRGVSGALPSTVQRLTFATMGCLAVGAASRPTRPAAGGAAQWLCVGPTCHHDHYGPWVCTSLPADASQRTALLFSAPVTGMREKQQPLLSPLPAWLPSFLSGL